VIEVKAGTAIFVYGTLKRGLGNAHLLAGQGFLGEARTAERYRMFDCGGYPGITEAEEEGRGIAIAGEIWEVDRACLAILDRLEGIASGLYRRGPVVLAPGFGTHGVVEAYFWGRDTGGLRRVTGGDWPG